MTINIPSEYEAVLNAVVTNGTFPTTEEALRHALELLAKEQRELDDSPQDDLPDPDEWEKRFRAWAASHPASDHFVDDSRESIYEGRGL